MYIKNEKANQKALAEMEKLIDLQPDAGTQEGGRLIQLAQAVIRYETWSIEGAPRRWLLQMPKGWTRPVPTYPPTETGNARTSYDTDDHRRTGRQRRTMRKLFYSQPPEPGHIL